MSQKISYTPWALAQKILEVNNNKTKAYSQYKSHLTFKQTHIVTICAFSMIIGTSFDSPSQQLKAFCRKII